MRDINDICRDFDDRSLTETDPSFASQLQDQGVLVTVCTKASIRFVRILPHALKAERKIDYPSAILGFQRSNFALVANAKSYDLVDLQNHQKIPLFEISTGGSLDATNDNQEQNPSDEKKAVSEPENNDENTDKDKQKGVEQLKPMVCAVGTNEFLLTSGTQLDEPAMGLIVNTDGDISRGTIAWPKYPSSIAVDYPYVASVIDNQVQFYSLHDQVLAQTIEYPSKPCIYNVSSPISQTYSPLTNKIKMVPVQEALSILGKNTQLDSILSEDQQKRLQKELSYAESLSVISSSLFVHCRETGIECLLSSPRIFHLEKLILEQHRMDEVRDEMSTIEVSTERAFIEIEYLGLSVGFGYLFNADFEDATSFWLEGTLDPRMVIYVFDKESVKGQLWTFNGLIEFIADIVGKIETLKHNYELHISNLGNPEHKTKEPALPASTKQSKKAKKGKKKAKQGNTTESAKDGKSLDKIDKVETTDTTETAHDSDETLVAKFYLSCQYYGYFLSEWLKRRDLESVVDKTNVFHSLEVAYLKHLLYQQKLGENDPAFVSPESEPKTLFYDFLRNEVIESTETALQILADHRKYYGQFLLYQKLDQEENACALWKRILEGEIQDSEFTQNELDFAEYLQHGSQNKQVIWDYGMWLVNRVPEIGLPIFVHHTKDTSLSSSSTILFDEEEVLKELKKLKNHEPWRKFLKILVYNRHRVSLQSQLIELTVDGLLDKLDVKGQGSTRAAEIREGIKECNTEYNKLPYPKRGYVEFLQSKMDQYKQQLIRMQESNDRKIRGTADSTDTDPQVSVSERAQSEAGRNKKQDLIEVNKIRIDLLKLLMFDGKYEAEAMRRKLESSGANEILIVEMCVIYSRLKDYEKCLETLIHSLLDLDQAIEYCLYAQLTIKGLMKRSSKHKKKTVGDKTKTKHDIEIYTSGRKGSGSGEMLSGDKEEDGTKLYTHGNVCDGNEIKTATKRSDNKETKDHREKEETRKHGFFIKQNERSKDEKLKHQENRESEDTKLLDYPPLAEKEKQQRLFNILFDIILEMDGTSNEREIELKGSGIGDANGVDDTASNATTVHKTPLFHSYTGPKPSYTTTLAIQELYVYTLLDRYGHFLDTITVLEKLPTAWPLEHISGWLRNSIRDLVSEKTKSVLEKSLARAENMNVVGVDRHWQKIKTGLKDCD